MKKLFLILSLTLFIGTFSYAQCGHSCKSSCGKSASVTVPAVIKSSFTSMYPDAVQVKWKKVAGNFSAIYIVDGYEVTVLLDKEGNVIQETTNINPEALPTAAADYVKKKYADASMEKVAKVTKGDDTIYKIILKNGNKIIKLHFDSDGKIILN